MSQPPAQPSAQPPATPPSSDIDGASRGEGAQAGASGTDDPGGQLDRRDRQTKARPPGTDHTPRSEQ